MRVAALFLDYDGVIVDSMTAKAEAMADAFAPLPREGADLPCIVSFGVAVVPGAPATDATEPPGAVPWCGVVAHPGLLVAPDAAVRLADFERCVAWTLWEQYHGQRH